VVWAALFRARLGIARPPPSEHVHPDSCSPPASLTGTA
jgi:hypothetical protein